MGTHDVEKAGMARGNCMTAFASQVKARMGLTRTTVTGAKPVIEYTSTLTVNPKTRTNSDDSASTISPDDSASTTSSDVTSLCEDSRPVPYRMWIFAFACLAQFILNMDIAAVAVALPVSQVILGGQRVCDIANKT